MASLKYGRITPPAGRSIECEVAASQYFYHNGVNVVYKDANGRLTLALTATGTVVGMAIVPGGRGAGTSDDYWLSSATAGKDKIAYIPISDDDEFMLPSDATIAISDRGNKCDIIAVNDGTATLVDPDASAVGLFIIQDLATNRVANALATDVIVKFNIAKQQAD